MIFELVRRLKALAVSRVSWLGHSFDKKSEREQKEKILRLALITGSIRRIK